MSRGRPDRLGSPPIGTPVAGLGRVIELHLRGRVAAGRRADLARFLADAIPFYERPGGIRVRMLWDLTDPDRFVEIIEYADQGAHDRDQLRVQDDPEMLEFLGRWRGFLAGPPQVESYRVDTPR